MSREQNAKSGHTVFRPMTDPPPTRRHEATIGELLDPAGPNGPRVRLVGTDGSEQSLDALTTVSLTSAERGRSVVLMFINGDPRTPVITGLVEPARERPAAKRRQKIELDADALLLTADSTLTLKCGKSSLTLTRDGRVIVRGVHLLSRASSVNRIRGGSIQLN
ncbi:MAG: DUF6484 domain-containing protein [Nannocystaceae bacterium]